MGFVVVLIFHDLPLAENLYLLEKFLWNLWSCKFKNCLWKLLTWCIDLCNLCRRTGMCTRLHKPVVPRTTYYFVLYGTSYFSSSFFSLFVWYKHAMYIRKLSSVSTSCFLTSHSVLFANLFPLSPPSQFCLRHCSSLESIQSGRLVVRSSLSVLFTIFFKTRISYTSICLVYLEYDHFGSAA